MLKKGDVPPVWHYPLVFTGYAEFGNVFLALLGWTAIFFPLQAILTGLYERGGSIWVPSLAHAGNNFVLWMLPSVLMVDTGQISGEKPNLVGLVPLITLAIWPWRSSPRHTSPPLETQASR